MPPPDPPAPPSLPARALRALRFLMFAPAAIFTVWLFVYAMPLSGLHAVAGLWALWPSRAAPGRSPLVRRLAALTIFAAAFATIPLVGLPEYATTTNTLHCRTLGFTGAAAPRDCDASQVERGRRIAAENGALFSTRERLGVHGFNLLLALGGYLVGLPEVADETAVMSFIADPLPPEAPYAVRRAQCHAGYGDDASKLAVLGPEQSRRSDFPMRSAKVRRAIAAGLPRLGRAEGSTLDLGEVHFVSGSTNLDAYSGAVVSDSVRVALALEVADSRLALTRVADLPGWDDDEIPALLVEVGWTGTIHYPGENIAFAVSLPLPWAPSVLRVSETVFCGMHADGAMNPYRLSYTWAISADDPRLHAQVNESERGLGERLALEVVGVAGMVLGGR